MTDPLAEISEKTATGETQSIYGEIREATGLPMVNLIFRHMATIDECLAWSWNCLKPLYTHSALYEAADRIRNLAQSPSVRNEKHDVVTDTLEAYVRGNMLNMTGLYVLRRAMREKGSAQGAIGAPFAPRPIARIMPLPDLNTMPKDAMERLRQMTRRTEGDSPAIPSLFRHFAGDPEAMDALGAIVAMLSEDGRLNRLTETMLQAGQHEAEKLRVTAKGHADARTQEAIERLRSLFPPMMARMTAIALAMRQP